MLPLPEKVFFFFFYSFLDRALRSIEILNANPGTDRKFKAMCPGYGNSLKEEAWDSRGADTADS